MVHMTLGDKIRIRREEAGLSQDELAHKLGYKSRSTIAKLESGVNDLTQSKLKAFADALNTTVADLLDWDDPIEKSNTEEAKKMIELFNVRLSSLLKESGMSQTELSEMLGVSRSTVNKWIIKKSLPRMGIIQKLSDYFGVPKSYFLEESAENKRAYYLDPETARLAQEVKDDPRYRALFDATRKLSPDAMKEVMNFIAYQSKKEGHDND